VKAENAYISVPLSKKFFERALIRNKGASLSLMSRCFVLRLRWRVGAAVSGEL
jgi:lipoprotein signal peptidase